MVLISLSLLVTLSKDKGEQNCLARCTNIEFVISEVEKEQHSATVVSTDSSQQECFGSACMFFHMPLLYPEQRFTGEFQ